MKILVPLLVVLVVFLMVWAANVIYCDNLTAKHYDEFTTCAEDMNRIWWNIVGWKVLKYSNDYAEVYFYCETDGKLDGGVVVAYQKNGESWDKLRELASWSKHGSASDGVWPYHPIWY